MASILPLNQQFSVDELTPAEADAAYPLVRAVWADVTVEDWRTYVRRRSMQGGLLGLFGPDGEVCGLLSYRLGERLRHGTVLALDDFVTFELSSAAPARRGLLAAAEELAREHGCGGIELRLSSRSLIEDSRKRWQSWEGLGFALQSAVFFRPLD